LFLNLKKEMDDSNQELNQEQGSIDIYIRVKPLTSEERDQKDVNSRLRQYRNSILICKSHKAIYVHMSDKFYRRFVFDRVFSEHSRNKEIFAVCCQKQVDRFLNGFNSSIFVYGQSGTGICF
jgi:hypothetical protein